MQRGDDSMNEAEIKHWLNDCVFRITGRRCSSGNEDIMAALTSMGLLYLCYEIKRKFCISLSTEQIEKNIFSSRSELTQYIADCMETRNA